MTCVDMHDVAGFPGYFSVVAFCHWLIEFASSTPNRAALMLTCEPRSE